MIWAVLFNLAGAFGIFVLCYLVFKIIINSFKDKSGILME